jgi:hypothetical protein
MRPNSASGETKIAPESEPVVERGGDLCPRTGLLRCRIRCPIEGMEGDVHVKYRGCNHAVALGHDRCLVYSLCSCAASWGRCVNSMCVFPTSLEAPLSYLAGISLGKTDGAMVTSGEAKICLRWETLGKRS